MGKIKRYKSNLCFLDSCREELGIFHQAGQNGHHCLAFIEENQTHGGELDSRAGEGDGMDCQSVSLFQNYICTHTLIIYLFTFAGSQFSMGLLHFCTSCKQRHCLHSGQSFQGCLHSEQPWIIEYLTLEQRTGLLTVPYNKNSVSLQNKRHTYCPL